MRLATLAIALLAGCAQPEGTITYDLGGPVHGYSQKYADWEQRGVMARIAGVCGSACTLVLRNKNICYAPDAQFIFHGVSHRVAHCLRGLAWPLGADRDGGARDSYRDLKRRTR